MSASAPNPSVGRPAPSAAKPAGPLPPPPAARRARPTNLPNPLLQTVGQLFALALCLSLPIAVGVIVVLLAIYNIRNGGGLLWLWIPMFLFIEPIALFCAVGIWRELTGWTSPRDYQR
jgi:hypothetical protein